MKSIIYHRDIVNAPVLCLLLATTDRHTPHEMRCLVVILSFLTDAASTNKLHLTSSWQEGDGWAKWWALVQPADLWPGLSRICKRWFWSKLKWESRASPSIVTFASHSISYLSPQTHLSGVELAEEAHRCCPGWGSRGTPGHLTQSLPEAVSEWAETQSLSVNTNQDRVLLHGR